MDLRVNDIWKTFQKPGSNSYWVVRIIRFVNYKGGRRVVIVEGFFYSTFKWSYHPTTNQLDKYSFMSAALLYRGSKSVKIQINGVSR